MPVKVIKCPDIHLPLSKYKAINISNESKQQEASRKISIVHISDTHLYHESYTRYIPNADILIHSGDFTQKARTAKKPNDIESFNKWLGKLPHKHKIIIAGNHEIYFNKLSIKQIQKKFTNAIYLQDTWINLYGLNIYGTPWNGLYI